VTNARGLVGVTHTRRGGRDVPIYVEVSVTDTSGSRGLIQIF